MSDDITINPYDSEKDNPYHEMKTILKNAGFSTKKENAKILRKAFEAVKTEPEFIELFHELTKRDKEKIGDEISYRQKFPDHKSKNEFIEAVVSLVENELE